MTLRQRLAKLFDRGRVMLAAIRVRITGDNKGWTQMTRSAQAGPTDRNWWETQQDLSDALEAWRNNFLIRQVVRLTTAYVVGDGIRVTSKIPAVDAFIQEFWDHPENRIGERLSAWCDELTRSGEIFPVLFTSQFTGMSQVRAIPALCISEIETDPEDYEKELSYSETVPGQLQPKTWKSKRTAKTRQPAIDGRRYRPEPMMLHYAINKPVGSVRGEGDLLPVLPWAKRYTEWLKDRVRFNRLRTALGAVAIEIDDDTKVEEKRSYYAANPPTDGAIIVHGKGEKISYPTASIQGFDAEPDGRALRLAFAAGANRPLHFFAEGSSATRSTAEEMGDPTHRDFRMRQQDFAGFLVDLCSCAWRRYELVNGMQPLDDLEIEAVAPDVSRADNTALAGAASTIVNALAVMKANGWIDDRTAVEMAFKFAGELLTEEEIEEILSGEGDNNGLRNGTDGDNAGNGEGGQRGEDGD